jgi:outer membrane protein OmpA-like peptidoglycan-associated protein
MHTGGQATQDMTNTAMNAAGGAAATPGNAASTVWAALGDFSRVKLPDGTELNIPSRGVEARLIKYLQDTSAPVGEITGFDFDRLLFDTNQATLQPTSYEQLNNVAAILKAYPTAKIRLGGYTDNTGDADANRRLSAARADNVMAELTRRGIDSGRLSATGYGQEHPVADNSTEDGRQKNRRISIRVAEK